MLINGVETSTIPMDEKEPAYPMQIKGRVGLIDGDFLAYQVSCREGVSVQDMYSNCETIIEKLRRKAAAEKVIIYLTPRGSNKGGRYNVALLKEYQGNRKDKPKPRYLHVIRDWLHQIAGAVMCENCEADDGMSMAQWDAVLSGNNDKAIVITKDKDLLMVPGLALNWDTGVITDTKDDHFGYIDLIVSDNAAKTKKLRGRGTKFFWAQLLMGDAADNISGLPKIYDPKYLKSGPTSCGPVAAYRILEECQNDKEAFETVLGLYRLAHKHQPFVNWRDGAPITAEQGFSSEACLLWMRRKNSVNDFLDWMKEACQAK